MFDMLRDGALVVAMISAGGLSALLGYALINRRFVFWPAPSDDVWRHHVSFGLFRVFCGATIVFAVADWGSLGWDHWARLAIGAPIMVGAGAATVYAYFFLGLDNTYCKEGGLVTGGVYAYTRNPQYVASVIATFGLALTTGSLGAVGLAFVLLAVYTLFALNEERWLWERYGRAFGRYAVRTPRFLDARSVKLARAKLIDAL
ncbi:MAG: heavy metal resistance protein CzcN [Rhodobacteraceae bacterium]|nr:MAG: heavy metal resistance protein CzcN [Paracoccaceae bacterium]